MSEQNYISRQITVYKTDKKLIEFIDKLKPAPTDFYAHIHSFGDKDEEGVKQTSCIGIVLQDYSKGTGKQTSIGHFQTAGQNAGKKTILKEICCCFGYGTKQNDKSAHLR